MWEDIISFADQPEPPPFFISLCGVSYCDGRYYIYRQQSDIYCFEYIIRGTGIVRTQGRVYHPSEGDVYMLMQGDTHDYCSDGAEPWTKIWFNAEGRLIGALLDAYDLYGRTHIRQAPVREEFEQILSIARARGEDRECFAECAVVFQRMLQKLHQRTQAEPTLPEEARILREYLDRHIDKAVNLERASEQIRRSPSQTVRIFKNAYGVSPYAYLLNQRVETAKLLLKNTNLLVKEIAYRLQFADEHYFSGFFKERTGKTPSAWRRG